MAEQIPYGVVVSVLNRLGSLAIREIGFMYGINSEMEKLKDAVEAIKAVLLDAEQKQHHDYLVRVWIKRLKQVLHHADDLLDDIHTQDLLRKRDGQEKVRGKVHDFFSMLTQVPFRFKMARKIKKIRDQLNAVAEEMSKLNFDRRVVVMGHHHLGNWRETSSFVHKEDIVGREECKEEIIDLLLNTDNNQNISLIAIVGIGGLGKTALAQLVYNDVEVKKCFQKKIWVCVSEDFDVKTLVKKILESLIDNKVDDLQLELLQNRLQENLNGQRYLLVLDDVWNDRDHEKWLQLRNYLMCGAQGSKILVTTRNQMAARNLGVKNPYILKGLTNDQSWALLKRLASGEVGIMTQNIESIGQKIAEKCGGVPLAVKTMGSMLRSTTEESDWETILQGDFWKSSEDSNSIMPILKLSYDNLSTELRQCFAYCSLYPKDWSYEKHNLIQLWMAQGYLECDEKQCMEDIGEQYFHFLLMRSFFQDVEMDKFGDVKYFKMHDLMHDLAQSVAGSDCCQYGGERKIIARPMHVYLEENPNCSLDSLDARNLRTILGVSSLLDDPSSILKFKRLRLLDLSHCSMEGLTKSVGELNHLRYLDLSYCKNLTSLPKTISNLINLQTLKLKYCLGLKLCMGVTKMINLRCLEVDGCKAFKDGMQAGLDKLTAMQYLSKFVVGDDGDKERKYAKLNEMKELNLRYKLVIENLSLVRDVERESKDVNLNAKKYIRSLVLDWGYHIDGKNSDCFQLLENLAPHPNLKKLKVVSYPGMRFSCWLSSLRNLVKLNICDCPNLQYLSAFDGLSSLQTLQIRKMDALKYIYYEGCGELLPTSFCSSSMPVHGTNFFPSLEKLDIDGCPNFKGWQREANVNGIDVEKHLSLPLFPRLSSLEIIDCPNLTCMPAFPNLKGGLTLNSCSMKPLIDTLKWNTTGPSATQDLDPKPYIIPSLSMLQFLLIQGDGIEDLPERWMENLTSLKHLSVCSLSSVGPLFCQMRHLPATLEEFRIVNINNLDAWSDDKDVSLPCQALHCLHSLQTICILYCPSLKALPEWICDVQSLRHIRIKDCGELESLPKGMHHLTNLQSLQISSSPLLEELVQKSSHPIHCH